jgi:hypothetical protein
LTDALRGDPKTLEWKPAAAFEAAKAALAAAVPLAYPAPNAVLSLATDASDTHVGGVLQQLAGWSWQPLAFSSKKLSGAGTRYSTSEREPLAAFSIKIPTGRVTILPAHRPQTTGHIPVPHHAALVGPPTAATILHRRVYIGYQTHTPGQENVVADALSRPLPAPAQQSPTAQTTSSAPTAEDWPEEGRAAPEWPILAAIVEAQAVNFSKMATAQRSS